MRLSSFVLCGVIMTYSFYRENETAKIWWVDDPETIGMYRFSFDRKKIFYLFRDYPHALTPDQKAIFDAENPFWVDFFRDRQ